MMQEMFWIFDMYVYCVQKLRQLTCCLAAPSGNVKLWKVPHKFRRKLKRHFFQARIYYCRN